MKKSLSLAALAVVTALALTATHLRPAHATSVKGMNAGNPLAQSASPTLAGLIVTGAATFQGATTLAVTVFPSYTLAAAQALVPSAAGQVVYCSNCSPAKLLVSTGTAAGNWADPAGGVFK